MLMGLLDDLIFIVGTFTQVFTSGGENIYVWKLKSRVVMSEYQTLNKKL